MQLTSVYRENNKLTSKFLTQGEVLANCFSSIQNGKVIQGVNEFIQHFGVSIETVTNSEGEFIISGHVTIPNSNFTPGLKVAANQYGNIGTIDKISASPFNRVGGIVYIIGIALSADTFYLNFDHTKPLVAILVEGRKYMLEYFYKADYLPPSVGFPAVCVSRLHPSDSMTITVESTTWPEFVPALRAVSWKVGANSENIAYSSFTPGVVTEVFLDPGNSASINIPLLEQIETMVRYHSDVDAGAALTGTHFLNLHLTARFKNEDCRIVGIDLINESITLDYDSSALSTDANNLVIYPHRLASIFGNTAAPDNLLKAQVRKLKDDSSLSSGYSPSVAKTDRQQGHFVQLGVWAGTAFGATSYVAGVVPTGVGANVTAIPVTDPAYGTLRVGKTNRGNLQTSYIYLYGGRYVE